MNGIIGEFKHKMSAACSLNVHEPKMEQLLPESEPLVSCLCVTEGRPAFMPWLLWCFDRQTWQRKELVILDSSPQPFQVIGRDDVRVIALPPGTSVPRKRNLALQQASGEMIAWFDDDDWQHPERLTMLVGELHGQAIWAGTRRGWFMDLASRRCQFYSGYKRRVVFNSAMFRREAVQQVTFPERQRKGSDTSWMTALASRFPHGSVVVERQDLFFWICHSANLSNAAYKRRFDEPLERLKSRVGNEAWDGTDAALEELQARLERSRIARPAAGVARRQSSPARRKPVRQISQPLLTQPADSSPADAVGAMIKVTVLDAPYLDVTARHMLAQAQYPFHERVIIVDRQADLFGKFTNRPRLSQNELDRILDKLLADGVVDTVRDVDMSSSRVREVMGRYFHSRAERVPTHAFTGGPIYATLFGLESMSCDYILQLDADMFFHAGPEGWLSRALGILKADPRLWLMMTHPGPPAGPLGSSLGRMNIHRARWAEAQQLWLFRTATTRYFLCDRRRLHDHLSPIFQSGGCAPLEDCFSLALKQHGAFRAALGDLESWHLHAWYHGDPFPQWAPALARLIEEGHYPALQRGEYDLRLDREAPRRQWNVLVSSFQRTSGDNAGSSVPQLGAERREAHTSVAAAQPSELLPTSRLAVPAAQSRDEAPIAVVIPVRNRADQRLRNALRSLNWQSAGRPVQVLIVSLGSRPDIDRDLAAICAEESGTLIRAGGPAQPWNKPLALNIGIRATSLDIPCVMTMDADIILAPNFLEVVLKHWKRNNDTLVLCRVSDLPQHVRVPSSRDELFASFGKLQTQTRLRNKSGSGGIQAAAREFFFKIRGYDEDLLWWGAMDGDILNRARGLNIDIKWINDETTMLHQWHARKHTSLRNQREIDQAKQCWINNHKIVLSRLQTPYRNPGGWGGEPTMPISEAP